MCPGHTVRTGAQVATPLYLLLFPPLLLASEQSRQASHLASDLLSDLIQAPSSCLHCTPTTPTSVSTPSSSRVPDLYPTAPWMSPLRVPWEPQADHVQDPLPSRPTPSHPSSSPSSARLCVSHLHILSTCRSCGHCPPDTLDLPAAHPSLGAIPISGQNGLPQPPPWSPCFCPAEMLKMAANLNFSTQPARPPRICPT